MSKAFTESTVEEAALDWLRDLGYAGPAFVDHALGHVNGTTVLHLSSRALHPFSFAESPPELIDAYTHVAGPLHQLASVRDEASETLA